MYTMKELEELKSINMAGKKFKNDVEKLGYIINKEIELKDIMKMDINEFVAMKDGYQAALSFLDYLDAVTDTIKILSCRVAELEMKLETKEV